MTRAIRLGAFVVVALLILAGGIFWIGNNRFLFSSTYRLDALFANVAGLGAGAEVRVGGLQEGTVRSIDLPRTPGGKVRVEMDLKRPTRDVIKKDSMASIKTQGLVGDQFLEISFGSAESPRVNEGDTLQSQPPVDMDDLIRKADVLLDTAKGAVQNLDETTGNLSQISSKITKGEGTIGALVNDKSLYRNVNAGATEFQEDMEALKHNFLMSGFFHKRGYEDSASLGKNEVKQLPEKRPEKTFEWTTNEIFDKPETAKLRKSKVLNDAGNWLQSNHFGLAVVAAATDMKGDSSQDKTLTEARAMVVRDYLVKNFKLDDTRIRTLGLGKTEDVQSGGELKIVIY